LTKPLKTSQEIMHEVQLRVDKIQEIVEDNEKVSVGAVTWNADDVNGCNWGISSVQNGTAYMDDILKIIDSVKHQVNLKID
jgi:hypothetical protein